MLTIWPFSLFLTFSPFIIFYDWDCVSVYWLFGLRLPTLEFVGYCVELGLGAEMRNSVRPHSDKYSLGSEGLRFSVSPVVQTQSSHCRSFGLSPGL